jgi:hypothetical protein
MAAAGSAPRPGGAGAIPGAAGGAASAATSPLYRPALRVVAVACQPARVLAGEEVELVLTYSVEGIPPGASFEVAERREILSGETVIATFDKPMSRLADTYTSVQRVSIPGGAKAGLYTVRGTVAMAGISASGTALLEVRAPAGR